VAIYADFIMAIYRDSHAKNIAAENEIWFKDAEDAKAHGYKPCGVCKP